MSDERPYPGKPATHWWQCGCLIRPGHEDCCGVHGVAVANVRGPWTGGEDATK